MGYREALADGMSRSKRKGFYPPCHICGQETYSMSYVPTRKYTCEACKGRHRMMIELRKGMARMKKPE